MKMMMNRPCNANLPLKYGDETVLAAGICGGISEDLFLKLLMAVVVVVGLLSFANHSRLLLSLLH